MNIYEIAYKHDNEWYLPVQLLLSPVKPDLQKHWYVVFPDAFVLLLQTALGTSQYGNLLMHSVNATT